MIGNHDHRMFTYTNPFNSSSLLGSTGTSGMYGKSESCPRVPDSENTLRRIARPNTTLLDCTLNLTQHFYDPGILPSSANQCNVGEVYLKLDL